MQPSSPGRVDLDSSSISHEAVALFWSAIRDDDNRVIKRELARRPELARARLSTENETALMIVARNGNLEGLLLLLPHSDPQAMDKHIGTALAHAACKGQLECVQALLPHCNARAVPKVASRITALMWATLCASVDCVSALLPHSDARFTGSTGRTALTIAATEGAAQCVRALLPHSDVHAVTKRGLNALGCAVHNSDNSGGMECVRALAPYTPVDAQTLGGQALLQTAMDSDCFEGVELLVKNSIDPLTSAQWVVHRLTSQQHTQVPGVMALIEREALASSLREGRASQDRAQGRTLPALQAAQPKAQVSASPTASPRRSTRL